jgi:SpoIID/LytB domain protein
MKAKEDMGRTLLISGGLVGTAVFTWTGVSAIPANAKALNPDLKVGIVQRFGNTMKDKLVVQAPAGDRLTLKFSASGKTETQQADKVQFEIQPVALPAAQNIERVVLGNYRSFETAETSGKYWTSKGIQVELAQPEYWQVWAKRDQYDTAVSQLLVLNEIKGMGYKSAYIDRKTITERPQLSMVLQGYRYNRDEIEITAQRGVIQVGNKSYGGRLKFQPNAYGTYTLVNTVPLETYLRGVVPHEIGRNAPKAAIEAQTVLARTYALRNLRRFKTDNYEICADTQCQVYEGLYGTDPVADTAISATKGQVLTYNNELIDALYSSTSGGVTAAFEDVWQGQARPYLKARIDAYPSAVWNLQTQNLSDEKNFRAFIQLNKGFNEVGTSNYFRWRYDVPLAEVTKQLKEHLKKKQHPFANFKTLQSIKVTKRSPAGRVQQVQVTTDAGPLDLVKDDVLLAFDAPNSLLFYVEPQLQADRKTLKGFVFAGGGLGHGVGLSQFGSYRLGQVGLPAAKILNFYYPGTSLQPLTDKIVFWPEVQNRTQVAQAEPASKPFSFLGFQIPTLQALLDWVRGMNLTQTG